MNRIDLEGRRTVVTGGARGIGFAIAERAMASGASLAIWDVDKAAMDAALPKLKAKGQGKAIAVTVDITDAEQVKAAVAATQKGIGGIDILVNNAGISGPNVKTWDYEIAAWDKVLAIDLTGTFLCCRAVAPLMRAQNYGRIVNIASIAGKEGNPNAPAYSAAKAGVIALTKTLGKEMADVNVTVNCVTPAVAKTDIFSQMTEEHIKYMLGKIPKNRFVLVEEIAALVAWLCSEECSFSTGAVFDISGGRATY
jgi:2-dehydro-3-deoxy-L-rhamnonate dehydrogenase (NAD+)